MTKLPAYVGSSARKISGSRTIWLTPSAARVTNQTIMTGPKNLPTASVPFCWMKNSAVMTIAPMGTTYSVSPSCTVSRPSMADMTEIAGVMTLSPKNRDAPMTPRIMTMPQRLPPLGTPCRTSAASAMMPPSPSLSARRTNRTYLIVTMMVSAQNIQEMTP